MLALVYEKASDVCVLLLYAATWVKVFVGSKSFWMESLGSLMYRIIFSVNRDTLVPFYFCVCFILFQKSTAVVLQL